MKKIKRLLTICVAVLLTVCTSVGFVACDEDDEQVMQYGPCEHNIWNNSCPICYPIIPVEGLQYRIAANGEYAVVSGYVGTDKEIIIAEEYEGVPVTGIASDAFYGCGSVMQVVLSDTITTINGCSFVGCDNLVSIVLGENLETIEPRAFLDCHNLVEIYNKSSFDFEAIEVEKGNIDLYAKNIYTEPTGSKLSLDEDGFVLYSDENERLLVRYIGSEKDVVVPENITEIHTRAFAFNHDIVSVVVGDAVKKIGDEVFANCDLLENVSLGDGVKVIGDSAFKYCTNLSEVSFGKSLTYIGYLIFEYCFKLTNITVSQENTAYTSIDGSLYTKNKTVLVQYGVGKSATTVVVPNSVTIISLGAFRHCSALTDLITGDNVVLIGDFAFADCENLTSVMFGKKVKYISYLAFSNTKLLHISVDEYNEKYTSEGGALYYVNAGKKYLQLYAARTPAETFIVPDDVYGIACYAFEDCEYLKEVVIGENVAKIERFVFSDCRNLTSVTIKNKDTILEENAFFQCYNVTIYR